MNERDSEAVAAQLVAKGYTIAASEYVADVVLLNTCSVRDNAEQKAINKMQNLAADIRKNRPNVVLGSHDLVLAPGEAAEFDTRVPHWFGSADSEPVEILSLFGPQGERLHLRARPRRPGDSRPS